MDVHAIDYRKTLHSLFIVPATFLAVIVLLLPFIPQAGKIIILVAIVICIVLFLNFTMKRSELQVRIDDVITIGPESRKPIRVTWEQVAKVKEKTFYHHGKRGVNLLMRIEVPGFTKTLLLGSIVGSTLFKKKWTATKGYLALVDKIKRYKEVHQPKGNKLYEQAHEAYKEGDIEMGPLSSWHVQT